MYFHLPSFFWILDIVVEPKGVAGRVLIIFVKIALLFLYVSYSAAIVVLLQSSDTSITTLADLLKTDMKLGVHEIAYNRYYFEVSRPVLSNLSKKILIESIFFIFLDSI